MSLAQSAIALFGPTIGGISAQRYFELVATMAERNVKARYRGSVLGIFWSLSNPLIMTGVYTLIFGTAFASYYGGSIVNYIMAVFTGLVVVNFFSLASNQALQSVVSNGSLVNKIRVPLSVFPVAAVTANLIQFVVGVLPVLVVVTAIVSRNVEHVLLLVIPALALLLVTIGASLIVSALFIYFRDLPYIYELVVFLLWMTSPIFYPAEIVPTNLRPYMQVNPIAAIVNSIRQLAFTHGYVHVHLMLPTLLVGLATALVGGLVFASLQKQAMDLL